ncbi:MAG TPA: hypothetical protein VIW24_27775 [Aldersonia sp.]
MTSSAPVTTTVDDFTRPGSTLLAGTCRECHQVLDTTSPGGEFCCDICRTWWPRDAGDGDIGEAMA